MRVGGFPCPNRARQKRSMYNKGHLIRSRRGAVEPVLGRRRGWGYEPPELDTRAGDRRSPHGRGSCATRAPQGAIVLAVTSVTLAEADHEPRALGVSKWVLG
jgi:hypothetical protein